MEKEDINSNQGFHADIISLSSSVFIFGSFVLQVFIARRVCSSTMVHGQPDILMPRIQEQTFQARRFMHLAQGLINTRTPEYLKNNKSKQKSCFLFILKRWAFMFPQDFAEPSTSPW
jgi:5-bromo-4-chloroindolyl phosphate hydrolysis protein